MLRRTLTRVSGPVSRLLLRTLPARDPWERQPFDVPLHIYGRGAERDFRWYFEGTSTVDAPSPESVCAWLAGCTYGPDHLLFAQPDYWQHPVEFERRRRGDCEDFALWSWRKLVQAGCPAEFVAGRCALPGRPETAHAWVLVPTADGPLVLDGTRGDPARMLMPVDAVRHAYHPEVSVDAGFQRYLYGGYLARHRPFREAS